MEISNETSVISSHHRDKRLVSIRMKDYRILVGTVKRATLLLASRVFGETVKNSQFNPSLWYNTVHTRQVYHGLFSFSLFFNGRCLFIFSFSHPVSFFFNYLVGVWSRTYLLVCRAHLSSGKILAINRRVNRHPRKVIYDGFTDNYLSYCGHAELWWNCRSTVYVSDSCVSRHCHAKFDPRRDTVMIFFPHYG